MKTFSDANQIEERLGGCHIYGIASLAILIQIRMTKAFIG